MSQGPVGTPRTETPGPRARNGKERRLRVKRGRERLRKGAERRGWLPTGETPPYGMIRGGGGNEVDGLMTFCHDARKGRYIGSHWPNHVRASAPLDPQISAWLKAGGCQTESSQARIMTEMESRRDAE